MVFSDFVPLEGEKYTLWKLGELLAWLLAGWVAADWLLHGCLTSHRPLWPVCGRPLVSSSIPEHKSSTYVFWVQAIPRSRAPIGIFNYLNGITLH
jgi:hypothetical protein